MFRSIMKTLASATVVAVLLCQSVIANENVYQSTLRSTAWIVTSNATGTGVLVDSDNGLVVTNYHVIEGHTTASVFFPTQRSGRAVSERGFYTRNADLKIAARVVSSDKSRDIAILKIERVPDGIVAIPFGSPCLPGQSIHSVGNPGASGALWSYAFGKVRQNYYIQSQFGFGKTQMQMLETTSPINSGDSGGPIVNDAGELVGISQSYHTEHRGYAYGVDISEITWFLKQYRKSDTAKVVVAETTTDSDTADVSSNPSSARTGSFKDLPLFAAAGDKK